MKEKSLVGGRLFFKNAAILTATSLLLRAVGMYFRIYVSGLIGAEGIGLYQLILSVYVLASGFASSGIVVAVTRMTADQLACGSKRGLRLVLRRCITVSMAMGMISAAACAVFAKPIACDWISDPRAVPSMRVISLALPFMSVSCCLRGYFTARRRVGVSAAAQITEQSIRIVLALVLLKWLGDTGAAYSCVAIMLADAISEAAGCLHIVFGYLRDRKRVVCPRPGGIPVGVYREIWDIAAPVTASHYLTTLLRTVESILVPDCLTRAIFSRSRALELFGMIKGMALPLILFPSTLLTALSALLLPEISQARSLGRMDRVRDVIARSMRLSAALAIPAAALFAMYPAELGELVYNQPELAVPLRVLAPFMPLMYAESVVTGILRGLGEQKACLRYALIDSVLRIALIIALVPQMGLNGFLAVMAVSNLLTPLLSMRRLLCVADMRFDVSGWLLKPLGAMLPGSAAAALLRMLPAVSAMGTLWRVCLCGTGAVVVYCFVLVAIGGIKRDDIFPAESRSVQPSKYAKAGRAA